MIPPVPRITSSPLTAFKPGAWPSVKKAFSRAVAIPLRQSWRKEPEPGFRPATVRTGWDPQGFWVYAELEDQDIFNRSHGLNDRTWEKGDIFEILVRKAERDNYFEFQITPGNEVLQIAWPTLISIEQLRGPAGVKLEDFFFVPRILESWTFIEEKEQRWRVLARVPVAALAPVARIIPGENWHFSFCRYDYTRGIKAPVLASTSAHTILSFHRHHEWGRIEFAIK